jgi:hypothetical protein
MKIEFKEKQQFTQWWLWVIILGTGTIPIIGIYKQIILGEKFGDNPMPDIALFIFAFCVFALIALFWFMQLKTEIDQDEIRIHFFPFVKKRIFWRDIKRAEILDYGFVGGWGIRLGTKYGTVYNTSGRTGLAIELKNGRKFCIGTQKGSEMKVIVEKLIDHNHTRENEQNRKLVEVLGFS